MASSSPHSQKRNSPNASTPRAATATENPTEPAAPRKPPSGLVLVATPIGNLADITLRALETLRTVDAIICEDTREAAKLLTAHGILGRSLILYHDHNAESMRPRILEKLKAGQTLALTTDAGLPLLADPGYKLVKAVHAAGIPVTALPGANAALTALQLSGLPPDRFFFAGFLPPKSAARHQALKELETMKATLIFYETAPRILETLKDAHAVFGNRDAALARELTKHFEEVRRLPLADLAVSCLQHPPKGEMVLLIAPPNEAAAEEKAIADLDDLLRAALQTQGVRQAAEQVAAETGLARRLVYQRALALKDETASPVDDVLHDD